MSTYTVTHPSVLKHLQQRILHHYIWLELGTWLRTRLASLNCPSLPCSRLPSHSLPSFTCFVSLSILCSFICLSSKTFSHRHKQPTTVEIGFTSLMPMKMIQYDDVDVGDDGWLCRSCGRRCGCLVGDPPVHLHKLRSLVVFWNGFHFFAFLQTTQATVG